MADFAERFAMVRKREKMTQSEVAERLDISFQAVSLWERGETVPEVEKIVEIARMFRVTVDWLLGEEENPLVAEIQENLSDRLFNEERMYTYVKTYAVAKGLYQTARVLPYARDLHKGQVRKGKDKVPYIYHPLLMACHALSLGLDDDNIVSTALLHDVCEDCGVQSEELPVNEETRNAVILLTKDRTRPEEEYYKAISENPIALIVKLLDRCNNVSGMAAGFGKDRMIEYVVETEKWFYPLLQKAKKDLPMYSNAIFLIKYHISSVLEAIKHQL